MKRICLIALALSFTMMSSIQVHAGELYDAARNGDVVKVRQLLEQGADVNAKSGTFEEDTPLHSAAFYGLIDVAKLLIEKGADVNARNSLQDTPLYRAIFSGVIAIFSNANNVAKLLIEKGANVNAKDATQSTPLHMAAYVGNIDIAKLLIEKGANVNAKDNDQQTPAMIADKRNHPELAVLIRKQGGGLALDVLVQSFKSKKSTLFNGPITIDVKDFGCVGGACKKTVSSGWFADTSSQKGLFRVSSG